MRAKATEIFERKGRQVAKLDGLVLNKRNKAICREQRNGINLENHVINSQTEQERNVCTG